MASSLLWDLGLRGLVFVKAHTPFSVRVLAGRHDWTRRPAGAWRSLICREHHISPCEATCGKLLERFQKRSNHNVGFKYLFAVDNLLH